MAKLKRALNLFELTLYGIGTILGAGIYALIGQAAGIAGNSLWMSFIFAAVVAGITGLSYCELGSLFPKEAAEYNYTKKAFSNRLLSFLIGWLMIITLTIIGATVALGFGGYFNALTGIDPVISATALIVIFSILNYIGIKQSAKANIVFTLVEVLGLLIIIFLGIPYFGSVNYFEMPNGFAGIFAAAILIFFAYLGFEDIANMAEEVKNPRENIPRAIIFSIMFTTLIYVLVSISVVSILNWKILGESQAPLADVAEMAFPGSSMILSLIALFATANTVLITLIVASRVVWGISKGGDLPRFLSEVAEKRGTPVKSIILIMIIAILFIMSGNIRFVAEVTDIGAFLIFLSVNASVIALRYKDNSKREFKVPLNIGRFPVLPMIGIIFSLYMMSHFKIEVIALSAIILIFGFLFYLLRNSNKTKVLL